MSDPLYAKDLLRLAAMATGAGRLDPYDVFGSAYNPICGDRVRVTLNLESGLIAQMAHETHACVLAQASASILGKNLKGADEHTLETLHRQVLEMLQGKGPPPAPFADYGALVGATVHRNRHKCVLLPIEAVQDALSNAPR